MPSVTMLQIGRTNVECNTTRIHLGVWVKLTSLREVCGEVVRELGAGNHIEVH